jgi:hypothetical protein
MAFFQLPHWMHRTAPVDTGTRQADPADLGTELGLEARLGTEVPAPVCRLRASRADGHGPTHHEPAREGWQDRVEDVFSHYGV